MLKELLQGKPLGHPLHPILIHFPIGLFILSFVLDVASLIGANNVLVRGSFYALALGLVTALLAAVAGLADWSAIRADHPARKTGLYHMLLNLAAVALYAISLGLRYGALEEVRVPTVPFVLSVLAIGILSASGYLGGKMVYEDGIAVGRHRHKGDPPRQTIQAEADASDGWVPVADADGLGEGRTLRVEVDRTVMTVVRLDGQLHAFQEFCTHRFGPLSEGSFHDGQVKCPWHGSCFDVQTGRVAQGPATVDLRTFEVSVRDGKICVRLPRPSAEERRTAG